MEFVFEEYAEFDCVRWDGNDNVKLQKNFTYLKKKIFFCIFRNFPSIRTNNKNYRDSTRKWKWERDEKKLCSRCCRFSVCVCVRVCEKCGKSRACFFYIYYPFLCCAKTYKYIGIHIDSQTYKTSYILCCCFILC